MACTGHAIIESDLKKKFRFSHWEGLRQFSLLRLFVNELQKYLLIFHRKDF